MEHTFGNNTSLKIGSFTVNLLDHSLTDEQGQAELLQPKFVDVLYYLAQQYPNLVSRDELIEKVWGGNVYVGEKALTNAIWHIRKSMHTDGKEYIQTVRKSGYRLLKEPSLHNIEQPHPLSVANSHPTGLLSIRFWQLFGFCALAALSSYLYFDDHTSVSEVTGITSSPGREAYPSVSSDGNKLVYYWKRLNEDQDLFYLDLNRPDLDPIQLTFDSELETRPVWSHQADRIFFIQKNWDRTSCSLMQLDVKTRLKSLVAPCKPDVNPALSISNDGLTLAFAGFDDKNPNVGIYTLDLTDQSAIPQRFSCQQNCEFSDRDAVFSPDGKHFLMTRRTQLNEEDVFLVDRQTSEARRLTEGRRKIDGMAWHPTENKIIFSAELANVRNGYLYDLDTNVIQSLNVEGFSFPAFIGGTSEVVFHDWQMKKYISTLELNENNASIPFPLIQSEYMHSVATYSATTQKIAFISNESGSKELWIADRSGANPRQLTNLSSNLYFPDWSPDGKYVAFLVRHKASNKTSVRLVDVNTLSVQTLNVEGLSEFLVPTWSQDSQHILISADDGNGPAYYSINIHTSTHLKISERSGGFILTDPANDLMWYSRGNGAIYQAKMSAPDSSETQLVAPNQMSSDYSWTKSDQGIYYLQRYADHEQINFYAFADATTKVILKAPLRTIENGIPLSYIAGENKLLITQSTFPQIDIKRLRHPLLESE